MKQEREGGARLGLSGRKIEAVLAGAARIFLERGLAAASMDDIAAAAAVSKRTLYQYFPSKEALFMAVVQRRVEAMIGALESLGRSPAEEPPSLIGLAQTILKNTFNQDRIRLARIIIAEAERMPELGRVLDQSALRHAVAEIERVLVQIADREGIHLEDPTFAAEFFHSTLCGLLQLRLLMGAETTDMTPYRMADIAKRVAYFARATGFAPPEGARPRVASGIAARNSKPDAKSRPR